MNFQNLIEILEKIEKYAEEEYKAHLSDDSAMNCFFEIKTLIAALKLAPALGLENPAAAPAPATKSKTKKTKEEPAAAPAPVKEPAQHSQRYINSDWKSYFDVEYLKVFPRSVTKNNMVYEFFATLATTGEKVDITFTPAVRQAWNSRTGDYILPASCELQERNGYLQVYIKSARIIGTEEEVLNFLKSSKKGKSSK